MRISSFISFVGFIMIIVATFCPILHFSIFNQTVYQLNKPYGLVFLLIAVVGIISTIFSNAKLTKLMAWVSLGLTIIFYIAALFRIHTSFSFIPFHSLAGYLSDKIRFKWGWYVLCIGSVLAIVGVLSNRKNNIRLDV
ncbi:hypothetical protein HDF18_05605 [Mucilaginibacter sp. X5P1]|uniref:hypothetical protein n=1 Tax=Mucilaginibacter sp. X5P1 TaxID=2723088 RepID=UPI0016119F98|nr:hypothetical protein [Mucilaginibacter sp. X5P1]MBB6137103.1 magnesium-transporting ATPase (P-type) [Mucilaginibacter sp. X5P1]